MSTILAIVYIYIDKISAYQFYKFVNCRCNQLSIHFAGLNCTNFGGKNEIAKFRYLKVCSQDHILRYMHIHICKHKHTMNSLFIALKIRHIAQ